MPQSDDDDDEEFTIDEGNGCKWVKTDAECKSYTLICLFI